MARKKWNFDTFVTGGNEDARRELKPRSTAKAKNSRFDLTDAVSGSFSKDKAKAERIRMDRYWRDHADTVEEPLRSQLLYELELFHWRQYADTLEEPFRTRLLTALDLFRERRVAET